MKPNDSDYEFDDFERNSSAIGGGRFHDGVPDPAIQGRVAVQIRHGGQEGQKRCCSGAPEPTLETMLKLLDQL